MAAYTERAVFSVAQINEYIKMLLESSPVLEGVWIRGEISNFKNQYSTGHLYFSLKDKDSAIKAVMFRSYASRLKFMPENGMKVLIHGRISCYTPYGEYQLYADEIMPDGVGERAQAFEQLKKKLSSEGLFDEDRKKALPKYPRRVGVITSASGAAIHDILNVSGRRHPTVEIVIYPALVQGEQAALSLVGGIRYFNNKSPVDVIIIGRGGGSAEDLWAFNDEGLARAVAASEIPVVSAVGHETDFTICDLVADLRAPTPSAAAEIVFPDTEQLRKKLDYCRHMIDARMARQIASRKTALQTLESKAELRSPVRVLNDRMIRIANLAERLERLGTDKLTASKNRYGVVLARLEGVNPLSVLSRGYAMVGNEQGAIVDSAAALTVGQRINISFSDGRAEAEVTKIQNIEV